MSISLLQCEFQILSKLPDEIGKLKWLVSTGLGTRKNNAREAGQPIEKADVLHKRDLSENGSYVLEKCGASDVEAHAGNACCLPQSRHCVAGN